MANIRSALADGARSASAFLKLHRPQLTLSWPAMSLLLIAPGIVTFDALAPHAPVAHADGLNLDVAYAPVAHIGKPFLLTLSTMSVFGTKGHFSIRVGAKLAQDFSIASVTPQPLTTASDRNETTYSFSGGGKNAVTFTLVPRTTGRTAATLQYGLDPPVPFSITTVP